MIQDRIKELRRVKASTLLANPLNYRKHPPRQKALLSQLLSEVGYADALLAYETPEGLRLIDGHLRAETTPDQEVPVLVLDVTEQEANKLLLTLDPLAGLAETDAGLLGELLKSTETTGDLAEWLDERVAELPLKESGTVPSGDNAVDTNEQHLAELLQKWPVVSGDLYVMGSHRLLCGDSRSGDDVARVLGGAKINLAFTSPPYASQRKYDEASGFKPIPPDEYVAWFEAVQANVRENLAPDGSWFVNIKEHCDDGQRSLYVKDLTLAHVRKWRWRFNDELIWTHGGIPGAVVNKFKNQFEPIFHYTKSDKIKCNPYSVSHESENVPVKGGGGTISRQQGSGAAGKDFSGGRGQALPGNVLSFGKNSEALGHSAAFPLDLPVFFIKAFSDPLDVVYEPFAGSGTTLIAAEQEGRQCAAIEISPKYCALIVERWHKQTGGTPVRIDSLDPIKRGSDG